MIWTVGLSSQAEAEELELDGGRVWIRNSPEWRTDTRAVPPRPTTVAPGSASGSRDSNGGGGGGGGNAKAVGNTNAEAAKQQQPAVAFTTVRRGMRGSAVFETRAGVLLLWLLVGLVFNFFCVSFFFFFSVLGTFGLVRNLVTDVRMSWVLP